MLDLLILCQDSGMSLGFFDNLVTILLCHGKNGFDTRKACKTQTFLENLRCKVSCPRLHIATVRLHQVPKFKLLEQIVDLLQSIILMILTISVSIYLLARVWITSIVLPMFLKETRQLLGHFLEERKARYTAEDACFLCLHREDQVGNNVL